jgi:hypothetical protein
MRSVADLNAEIVYRLRRIPRTIDAIVGIPRSGALAASLIALHLQWPRLVQFGTEFSSNHLLLVDDTLRTGKTLRQAMDEVQCYATEITTLVVYGGDPTAADIVLARCPEPRLFEWNLWRSFHLPEVATDLDDVLCVGPGKDQRDGEAYARFVAEAPPLYRPTRPLRAIITCRLERYRTSTEAWLASNGISYARLEMMNYPSHAVRRAAGQHALWKAERYRACGAGLFVESNVKQAIKIARTGPVWCVEDQHVYGGVA